MSTQTYKYKTHADIVNLSVDNILSLPPNEVDPDIENVTGGVSLPENKMNALKRLLDYKKLVDAKNLEENMLYRFLTRTKSPFSLLPVQGTTVINVLVDTKLEYIPGNSIIITNVKTPLETRFEATVVSYSSITGMLSFSNIVNLKGTWSVDTKAIVDLDFLTFKADKTYVDTKISGSDVKVINSASDLTNNCYNIASLSDGNCALINNLPGLNLSALNGIVRAMCFVAPYLYIGGDFTTFNNNDGQGDITTNRICRYNTTTGLFSTLTGSGSNTGVDGLVRALCLVGTNLYIGGDFTTFNNGALSITTNRICKYSTSSEPQFSRLTDINGTSSNTGFNSGVRVLCRVVNDLYIGGEFITFNNGALSITTNYICKYDTSLSTPQFSTLTGSGSNTGVSNNVSALCLVGTNLYIGGQFPTFNNGNGNITTNYICKYNTFTTTPTTTTTIATTTGNNEVSGNTMTTAYNPESGATTTTITTTEYNPTTTITTITTTTTTTTPLPQFSRLTGSGSNTGVSNSVLTICAVGTDLCIGGMFTTFNNGFGSTTTNYICKYSTSSITPQFSTLTGTSNNTGVNNFVNALCFVAPYLYIGGNFLTFNNGSDNTTTNFICKYDTSLSTPQFSTLTGSNNTGVKNNVLTICAVETNDLYIGGQFTNAFGRSANYLFSMKAITEIKYNNVSLGFIINKSFETINSFTHDSKKYITFMGKQYIINI